jgi:hypothetical protein
VASDVPQGLVRALVVVVIPTVYDHEQVPTPAVVRARVSLPAQDHHRTGVGDQLGLCNLGVEDEGKSDGEEPCGALVWERWRAGPLRTDGLLGPEGDIIPVITTGTRRGRMAWRASGLRVGS